MAERETMRFEKQMKRKSPIYLARKNVLNINVYKHICILCSLSSIRFCKIISHHTFRTNKQR